VPGTEVFVPGRGADVAERSPGDVTG
jgi:hypothetical protein